MKGKKILSAIIAGAMVLGTMSFPAFAESSTLPDAVDGVITLTDNITLTETLTITSDTTIDLAGFNITSADVADSEATLKTLIDVQGATLTINGEGTIEPGTRTNITNYNNTFNTISASNGATVIIDGATVKGSKGINTKYGGTAVYASQSNVTIQNGAKIYGGECAKNGITSSNYEALNFRYNGEAGKAVSAWNSPLTVTDSEIYGGNGTADADTQTSYISGGSNQAAGGLGIYAVQADTVAVISNSTVKGGDSTLYNAENAVYAGFGSKLTVEGCTITGGSCLVQNGYGIAGAGISVPMGECEVTVTDSNVTGGSTDDSWIGSGIDVARNAEGSTVKVESSEISAGSGAGNSSSTYAIETGTPISVELKDTTLKANEANGKAVSPATGSVTAEGTLTVEGGTLNTEVFTNGGVTVSGDESVTPQIIAAKIGNTKYSSLADAVAAAQDGDTIVLLSDTAGNGIQIPSGSNVTIDFNGFTYNIDGTTVGSSGTATNGFQLLKGSNITFKNGTITSNKAQILIQNYSNLTLENMTLDGSKLRGWSPYTLSNNCGNTVIKGNTNIIANVNMYGYAFDCYYWPNGGYPEGVTVTLGTDFTGTITGKIEMTDDGTDTANAASKQDISISGGTFSADVSAYCTDGFSPKLVNGVYVVDNAAGVITVEFAQRADDKNSYDIVLKGDGEGIYEFVSAELQFENNSKTLSDEPMNYEITGTDDVNVIANTTNSDRYGFYLKDGTVNNRLSGSEVIIGKLTFPAQGKRDFKVTAAGSTVITTLKGTHLETTYTATGVSKLEAGAPINDEVAAATRNVVVNVDFAHTLDNTGWNGDHQITVTLKDAFGNIVGETAHPLTITDNVGTYTFEDVAVGRITVTLKAPGFRTYTYTTTVEEGTDPLVLTFWNDTKRDAEKAVEIGGRTMKNNFVVGDIAMDYIVDKYDLAAVTSYYGTYNLTDESKIKYDLNRDGNIDITDVAYVLHNFGF